MTRLRKSDWRVAPISRDTALRLVEAFHYARGAANTGVHFHGLFRKDAFFEGECQGVAWWLPPTRRAAESSFPEKPEGVLALSRLAIAPDVPANACSFLLARSRRLIDPVEWPCLVTYADEWQGHTGAIYRADNWTYVGRTREEAVYVRAGRVVSRKAGPKTRSHDEMLALGAECMGKFAKHKFMRVAQ